VGKVKNKAKMAKKTIERDFGELEKKIRDGSARVAFIGLGKMGLPSALAMAEAGFSVVGVDVNESVVEKINRGESPYLEPGTREALRRVKKRGRFRATTRYSEIKGADVVLCAVPTLITRDKRVDYSIVEKAFREAGKHLKRGSLVVFESNVTPGVTEGLVRESKAGRMFRDLRAYERVVAGVTPRARELAALFFKRCGFKTLLASSCKVAELEKLYANIYKDVTIAAANELADYCDALGIDVREVIRFARLIPGINIPEPGIGVGGNCLPVDPYFLIHDGRRVGVDAKLARAAREVNDGRAAATARKIIEIAAASKATRVVLLGAAFRPDTHETAYSPALEVYARVAARFPQTRVFDPLVGSEALARLGVREASDRDLRAAELVFELVPHSAFEKPKGLLGKRVGKRIIRLGDLV
jgi:nucleotide sugar dehydrogenase